VASAQAIAKGLAAGHSAENPAYWLHICGTGLLMWVSYWLSVFAMAGQ
jgi:hypothetical protein